MKNLILYSLIIISFLACSKEESTPLNKIEYRATCNSECFVSAFIERRNEIIWQENSDFSNEFTLEKNIILQPEDKVLLFVLPKDGETHFIKTEILVDGNKVANQDKVCHAGGGCSVTIE